MPKYDMASHLQTWKPEVMHSSETIPIRNNGMDNPMISITRHKLNSQNYLLWLQSVMMLGYKKGKDDHLIRATNPPAMNGPKYRTWKVKDYMIMS